MKHLLVPATVLALLAAASPASASTPHLVKRDYGATTRTLTTAAFTIGGAYREVDVVDAIAVRRAPGAPCKAIRVTLLAAHSGHRVASRSLPCTGPMPGEVHWSGLRNGSYRVRVSVVKPVQGERYAVAFTVVHGVR